MNSECSSEMDDDDILDDVRFQRVLNKNNKKCKNCLQPSGSEKLDLEFWEKETIFLLEAHFRKNLTFNHGSHDHPSPRGHRLIGVGFRPCLAWTCVIGTLKLFDASIFFPRMMECGSIIFIFR